MFLLEEYKVSNLLLKIALGMTMFSLGRLDTQRIERSVSR